MQNEKLLILGAGINQVPIINKAKQFGLFTVVASIDGHYPGFKLADKAYKTNILDKEELLNIAQKEKIDGVITDQNDLAVPSVAYIAEKLGLPGIGYECALNFTNKLLMKKTCEEVGIPVPRYIKATNANEGLHFIKKNGLPVVVKPVDSTGSKGVFKIDNEKDFEEKFNISIQESFTKAVLVEEHIEGEQFLSRGYVDNYKLRLFAYSNRYYFDLPTQFLPNLTVFPAKMSSDVFKRMTKYHHDLINKLRPRFGASGVEWIYNKKTDSLYLIEMALRGGGAFISSHLIPYAYGIELEPYIIHASLNKKYKDIFSVPIISRSSAYMSFLLPQGEVIDVKGLDEIEKTAGVIKSYVNDIAIGQKTNPAVHKGSRYGPILIGGNTRADVENTIQEIRKKVHIKINTGKSLEGIVWE